MQPDEIKDLLKAWGHATVNRFAFSRADRSTHVLQQVRDQAPGTSENAARELVGRDGRERRRFMAERSGVKGLRIVPTYAVDPVRASNDAGRPHDNPEIAVDQGLPDHLIRIDFIIREMDRRRPMMAACVREEYTGVGSQEVKSRRVKEAMDYEGEFSRWMYRAELDRAILWIESRMDQAA